MLQDFFQIPGKTIFLFTKRRNALGQFFELLEDFFGCPPPSLAFQVLRITCRGKGKDKREAAVYVVKAVMV